MTETVQCRLAVIHEDGSNGDRPEPIKCRLIADESAARFAGTGHVDA